MSLLFSSRARQSGSCPLSIQLYILELGLKEGEAFSFHLSLACSLWTALLAPSAIKEQTLPPEMLGTGLISLPLSKKQN